MVMMVMMVIEGDDGDDGDDSNDGYDVGDDVGDGGDGHDGDEGDGGNNGDDDDNDNGLRPAPNDTAYKQRSCHRYKLLCKIVSKPPAPQQWWPDLTFFWQAGHAARWMGGTAPHKSG